MRFLPEPVYICIPFYSFRDQTHAGMAKQGQPTSEGSTIERCHRNLVESLELGPQDVLQFG